MQPYLNEISAFLNNMAAYPAAAAIMTMALFAVLAAITDHATRRVLKTFCKKYDIAIEDEPSKTAHHAIWVVTLLVGAIVIFKWLNLLPQYQHAILGVFQTLILLVVATTINRFMKELFHSWAKTHDKGTGAILKIESTVQVVLLLVGTVIFLNIWKINLRPLLASAGVAGIIGAIVAKDTLSNLVAGFSLLIDAPFKIDDYIVLETGERGRVTGIGLRSTNLLTRDDVQITIPNAIMAGSKIINESAPFPRYRVRIKVGVAYGTEPKKAEEALLSVAHNNSKISQVPEPRVRAREFGDYDLKLELLCWAKHPKDRPLVVHQLITSIYERFQEENIIIPVPVQDIYLHSEPENSKHSGPADESSAGASDGMSKP